MAEDIHCKTLIYSRVEKKYIDGLSFTTSPEYSPFKPLYEGRNYDLFSVFGSRRGDFPQLDGGNYGIPEFLPKTYNEYLKNAEYYGYVWWKIGDFIAETEKYLKTFEDPAVFWAEDDFVQELIAEGNFDLKSYDMTVTPVQRRLKDMLKRAKQILDLPKQDFCSIYDKLVDLKKTVFLFYFDC